MGVPVSDTLFYRVGLARTLSQLCESAGALPRVTTAIVTGHPMTARHGINLFQFLRLGLSLLSSLSILSLSLSQIDREIEIDR